VFVKWVRSWGSECHTIDNSLPQDHSHEGTQVRAHFTNQLMAQCQGAQSVTQLTTLSLRTTLARALKCEPTSQTNSWHSARGLSESRKGREGGARSQHGA
jgi:hypothetical protein